MQKLNNETRLSILILLALGMIGTGIFFTQFRYNPALFPAAENLRNGERADLSPPKDETANFVGTVNFDGITPMTPAEIFGPETLSDKIDGKAELYLSAGFLRLQSHRLILSAQKRENTPNRLWTELFIYDMGNPSNAFSVFSMQRRENAVPTELTRFSYQTENAIFLTHGRYYLEIIASEPSESIFAAMRSVAEHFIRDNPSEKNAEEKKSVSDQELFPETGLDKESITLISANVFGYDKSDQVMTASYNIEDTELTAFISHRKDHEDAENLAAGYSQFLINFRGKAVPSINSQIKNIMIIEIMDTYEIIFTHGNFFAGIHEAENREKAEKLADMLYQRLNEVLHE